MKAARRQPRILFANAWGRVACLLVAVCLSTSCDRSGSKSAGQNAANQETDEIRLEAEIERLLGELNSRHREVTALAASASVALTPDLRKQAASARHQIYSEADFVQATDAAREAIESKISGLAAERAALQNSKEPEAATNLMTPLPRATNYIPDERTEESNLKTRLVEVRAQTEELLLLLPALSKAPAVDRGRANAANEEFYSQENYLKALRAAKSMLEKKLAGFDAEEVFYQNLAAPKMKADAPTNH